ncbi:GGDEF domain-containing protein [Actinomycetospora chibensis]|uniref:Diguanylate cyclase n=1 Tax=Actinomycetospora chibensis TaxID=663606 RepID=A0ABV9RM02_9PSEU|nr:GGDEF domain-containing protein [Actinomycetospora chibensis]MDD7925899.1 GGDEF domain-containing protein [Actinomycetospora chibensis]
MRAPARAELVGRASAATLTATRVPCPDPQGSLATLEAVLRATAARPCDPGLRALLLRQTLVARIVLAADPGHVASGPALDELIDELLTLVADHGLTLFAADAHMLLARRAMLDADDDRALSAVSTALSHLEEPVLVDHAPTVAEHRENVQGSRRLAAGTLVSLGLHDLAETLLDQAHALSDDRGPGYEHVRVGLSWGLRLERGGHHGSERLRAAADAADGMRRGASAVERPLLRAAGVLGRHAPGPAATTVERHLARHDALALARVPFLPSHHDRLLVHIARARALERAGDAGAAATLLAEVRARPPRGEQSLMLSVTRELARLRTLLAVSCDPPNRAAKAALGDYTADLEAELWALQQARVLSLQTRLAHDRLSREHGQVAALALADPLTGLPNRRALDGFLDEALAAAALRGTGPGPAVVMIDVDRFKQINDAISHARGDEVLRGVAAALRSSLRAPDLVARYGGDEFVVVLPDTAAGDAGAAMARARAAVAALPTGGDDVRGTSTPRGRGDVVTLSVGVVAARPGEDATEVLARADAAMYAVKRAGGDAVRVHEVTPSGSRS